MPSVAACVAAVLPALIPYERFLQLKVRSDTLMIVPLWNVQDEVGLPRLDDVVLLGGIVAAALFLFVPRRYLLALPAVVLAYFAIAIQPIQAGPHGMEQAAAGALFEGIRTGQRDWIDRAAGDDTVAVLWTGKTNRFTVLMNEFFNRSVGPVYTLGGPMPGGLPETAVRVDPETGEIRRVADGSVVEEGYVLTDGTDRPRRRRRCRRRAARDHAVRRRRPARLDDERDRRRQRPLVRPRGLLPARPLPRRRARGHARQRPWHVQRRSRRSSPPTRTGTRSRRSPSARTRR